MRFASVLVINHLGMGAEKAILPFEVVRVHVSPRFDKGLMCETSRFLTRSLTCLLISVTWTCRSKCTLGQDKHAPQTNSPHHARSLDAGEVHRTDISETGGDSGPLPGGHCFLFTRAIKDTQSQNPSVSRQCLPEHHGPAAIHRLHCYYSNLSSRFWVTWVTPFSQWHWATTYSSKST